jgi:hypothetical protein
MAKKIFVAFTHEQPSAQVKDFGKVLFAFADDENHLHFGGSPKKSYLLTPAQAANVMFSKRSVETRFSIFHCIDITKRELKILREEFKKNDCMPFEFFEKVMLDDKYFPDATVVVKLEPEAVVSENKNYRYVVCKQVEFETIYFCGVDKEGGLDGVALENALLFTEASGKDILKSLSERHGGTWGIKRAKIRLEH